MRSHFKFVLLLFSTCLGLGGCATTLTLTPSGSQVLIAGLKHETEVKECLFVRNVSALGNEKDLPELKIILRNQAAELSPIQANVVLSDFKLHELDYLTYGKTSYKKVSGKAYLCHEQELKNLRKKAPPEISGNSG